MMKGIENKPQEALENKDFLSGTLHPKKRKNQGNSSIAQLMVLLNGAIITLTAFVTLNVFIGDMQENRLAAQAWQIEATLSDKTRLLQQDLSLLTTLISTTSPQRIQAILNKNMLDGLSDASLVMWQKDDGSQPYTLFDRNDDTVSPMSLAPVISSINKTQNDETVNFATFFINDPKAAEPLVFIKRHHERGHILTAFTVNELFGWQELKRLNPTLKSFSVIDKNKNNQFVNFGEVSQSLEVVPVSYKLGNYEWVVNAQFASSDEHTILGYVPLLMLFFGLTLTFIGSFYVHNNQRSTRKLTEMNSLLRDKNDDIKVQMERTESLYESLQASERDYSAVINSVNDIIFETDDRGRIVFLNDAWQRLTSVSPAKSLGKPIYDFIHEQDRDEAREAFDNMIYGSTSNFRVFTRLQTGDDTYRFVELVFSLTRLDDAGNKRLVGMVTDIEERRQAEIALRDAERRYRNIFENAVSGLYQITPDGKFISANGALAKLMGYSDSKDMMRNPNCNKNKMIADHKERDLLSRLVKRQGQVRNFELRYETQKGEIIWVSENIRAVYDEHGDISYYEGALDDISARKEAETAMQQARLESDLANRAKTEFLANMSHELRTPLNAIIGFSDVIGQESLGSIEIPAYLDYAREINMGGKQLLKIINEILEVSRIELSEKPINESSIDLRKVCDTCVSLVRGKGEDKMIVIDTHLAPELPIIVGSETGFKQMILNLLHNALSMTDQGGQINIESVLDQDHSVRITVSDNGHGMDPSDIRRALQPLNEPHSAELSNLDRKDNENPMFGLSFVRSLIAQHDGRLEIASEIGVGTTATLIIPPERVVGILQKTLNRT